MSFIPKEFKEKTKKDLDKIEIFKRELTADEIREKMLKFIEFYEQNEEPDNFYFDGSADWVMIQSPAPTEDESNGPREAESEFTDDNYLWICKYASGQISVFGTAKQMQEIGWDNNVIVRGKLNRKFRMANSRDFYKSLTEMCKMNGWNMEDLTPENYYIFYSINVYQVIK